MASPVGTSLRPTTARDGTARPALPVRIRLLGGFEFEADGATVELPGHAQRLLAFLALQPRTMHRAYIAGRLWPDVTDPHAHGCLRTTLWRVGRAAGADVVHATPASLGLASAVRVDAIELDAVCESVFHETGPPSAEELFVLEHAGELLSDWYEDWAVHERERLRLLRLLALEAAAERLLAENRRSDATHAALAALAGDPLRESAHRLLIRIALRDGNVAEALRQFGCLRADLDRELGLEPSEQTRELVRGLVG